jgi:hypothetical protein
MADRTVHRYLHICFEISRVLEAIYAYRDTQPESAAHLQGLLALSPFGDGGVL